MKKIAIWYVSLGVVVAAAAFQVPFSLAQEGGDGDGTPPPDGDCIADVRDVEGNILRSDDWTLGLGAPFVGPTAFGISPFEGVGSEDVDVLSEHRESATDPCRCLWGYEALRIDKKVTFFVKGFGFQTVTVTFGSQANDEIENPCQPLHPEELFQSANARNIAFQIARAIGNRLNRLAIPGPRPAPSDVTPFTGEDEGLFFTSTARVGTFTACNKKKTTSALDSAEESAFVVPTQQVAICIPDPDVVTQSCCPKVVPPKGRPPKQTPKPFKGPPHQPPRRPIP